MGGKSAKRWYLIRTKKQPFLQTDSLTDTSFFTKKKFFFAEKKCFYTDKQELYFFEKKCFFGIIFSEKCFSKISKSFPPIKKLMNFFFNFFEKTFPKKTFVFQKKDF